MKTLNSGQFLFFSDLHIKNNSDPVYRGFVKLLSEELNNNSLKGIFLLGDIFDLLVGPFPFWIEEYSEFFRLIDSYKKKGVEIVWVEGNHDFFLDELVSRANLDVDICDPDYVFCVETPSGLRKIFVSHGDLVNPSDTSYFRWRFITRNFVFRSLLKAFGNRAGKAILKPWGENLSRNSRKSHAQYDSNNSKLKQMYRDYAESLWKSGFDGVFMGHCHIPDEFALKTLGKFYFNAGSRFDLSPPNVLRYGFWDTQSSDFPKTKLYSTI